MNLNIKSLQHVGILVTDIKRLVLFYETLGFHNAMASAYEVDNETGVVSMMQRANIIIKLYQPTGEVLGGMRNRKNGHIDHIAFDVDDIDQAFNTLHKNHYHIIEQKPVFLPFWKKGCKYFNITGPNGERLEFNQIL